MKLPAVLLRRLANLIERVGMSREPDVVIGDEPMAPYLRRWFILPRNPIFNVYLHQFCRSDDDRALHSHPWLFNASILLRGAYLEHTPKGKRLRDEGHVYLRGGRAWHRVELLDEGAEGGPVPVWTLFITGPRVRKWGFACPQGFVHWRDFTAPGSNGTRTGKGCGE